MSKINTIIEPLIFVTSTTSQCNRIHNIQSVFYDLLDQHNRIITSDSVEVDINEPIDELKRAVYIDNSNNPALQLCSYTNLHIYPPGTTDFSGQSECIAEDTVEDVLAQVIPIVGDTSTAAKRVRTKIHHTCSTPTIY